MTEHDPDYYRAPQTLTRIRSLTEDLTLVLVCGKEAYVMRRPAAEILRSLMDALDHVRTRRWRGALVGTLTPDSDERELLRQTYHLAPSCKEDSFSAPTPDLLVALMCLCENLRFEEYLAAQLAIHRDRYSRPARWFAQLSARSLPGAYRARYVAEYASEMAELPRGQQVRYALNAVLRTGLLRRTLRAPARRVARGKTT
jgi:hypothetical protein